MAQAVGSFGVMPGWAYTKASHLYSETNVHFRLAPLEPDRRIFPDVRHPTGVVHFGADGQGC